MKTIIVAVALVGSLLSANADLTDEQKQKILTNGKACVAETGVNPELIKAARQGKFTEDDKLKAFTFCMSKKIGFQNDAGEILADVVKQKLGGALGNQETANQIAQKCLVAQSSPQETAFHSFKCYYETTPTHLTVF
ncbi:B2 protein-like [Euwallacea similis]|uniref:B2 protein-like n=1 Tax=Euwallacea similis TaxID=1736056 RepID=UPI00344D3B6F